jgi:hypothetical protein
VLYKFKKRFLASLRGVYVNLEVFMTDKEALLMEKYGKIRGSQTRLANELKCDRSYISNCFAGRINMGSDCIFKFSRIFNKSEAEIRKIFGINEKKDDSISFTGGHKGDNNSGAVNNQVNYGTLEDYRSTLVKRLEAIEQINKTIEDTTKNELNAIKLAQDDLALKLDLIAEKLKNKSN